MTSQTPQSMRERGIKGVVTNKPKDAIVKLEGNWLWQLFNEEITEYLAERSADANREVSK